MSSIQSGYGPSLPGNDVPHVVAPPTFFMDAIGQQQHDRMTGYSSLDPSTLETTRPRRSGLSDLIDGLRRRMRHSSDDAAGGGGLSFLGSDGLAAVRSGAYLGANSIVHGSHHRSMSDAQYAAVAASSPEAAATDTKLRALLARVKAHGGTPTSTEMREGAKLVKAAERNGFDTQLLDDGGISSAIDAYAGTDASAIGGGPNAKFD